MLKNLFMNGQFDKTVVLTILFLCVGIFLMLNVATILHLRNKIAILESKDNKTEEEVKEIIFTSQNKLVNEDSVKRVEIVDKYSFLFNRKDAKTNFTRREVEFMVDLIGMSDEAVDIDLLIGVLWTNSEFDRKAYNTKRKTYGLSQTTHEDLLDFVRRERVIYVIEDDIYDDIHCHILKVIFDLREIVKLQEDRGESISYISILSEYYKGSAFALKKTKSFLWRTRGIVI